MLLPSLKSWASQYNARARAWRSGHRSFRRDGTLALGVAGTLRLQTAGMLFSGVRFIALSPRTKGAHARALMLSKLRALMLNVAGTQTGGDPHYGQHTGGSR
jgi:hypothetical protein